METFCFTKVSIVSVGRTAVFLKGLEFGWKFFPLLMVRLVGFMGGRHPTAFLFHFLFEAIAFFRAHLFPLFAPTCIPLLIPFGFPMLVPMATTRFVPSDSFEQHF